MSKDLSYKTNAEFGLKLLDSISKWRSVGLNGFVREPDYRKFNKQYEKLMKLAAPKFKESKG